MLYRPDLPISNNICSVTFYIICLFFSCANAIFTWNKFSSTSFSLYVHYVCIRLEIFYIYSVTSLHFYLICLARLLTMWLNSIHIQGVKVLRCWHIQSYSVRLITTYGSITFCVCKPHKISHFILQPFLHFHNSQVLIAYLFCLLHILSLAYSHFTRYIYSSLTNTIFFHSAFYSYISTEIIQRNNRWTGMGFIFTIKFICAQQLLAMLLVTFGYTHILLNFLEFM